MMMLPMFWPLRSPQFMVSHRSTCPCVVVLPMPRRQEWADCICGHPGRMKPTLYSYSYHSDTRKLRRSFLAFAAFALISVGFSIQSWAHASQMSHSHFQPMSQHLSEGEWHRTDECFDHEPVTEMEQLSNVVELNGNFKDEKLKDEFEQWKLKTYALIVSLRIVALRDSIPPTWLKDFLRVNGKRLNFCLEYRDKLVDIFSELSLTCERGYFDPGSAMIADVATVGDSWLSLSIRRGIIEPINDAEEQDWYKALSDRWKVYLRRNNMGELDANGKIWAVPYRWGSTVIAYKSLKFKKHKLAPIEDWKDLFMPELRGRIAMVNSPREVIGAILKYMGSSYNVKDLDRQVPGGMKNIRKNLLKFQDQVSFFDSLNFLKAFELEGVWVAVGWSSDVLPGVRHMPNVTVVVPRSGASLWADLWVIPSTSCSPDVISGCARGPSPLVSQWFEFCLQHNRSLPFFLGVVPGASPTAFEASLTLECHKCCTGSHMSLPYIFSGTHSHEILDRCDFLEPLSETALTEHQWLVSNMQQVGNYWMKCLLDHIMKAHA